MEFSFDLNELPSSGFEGDEEELEDTEEQLEDVEEELEDTEEQLVDIEEEHEDDIIDMTLDRAYEDIDQPTDPDNAQRSRFEDRPRNRKFLSNAERQGVYSALLEKSVNGKLKRTTTTEVSALFSVPIRVVQRIWKQAKDHRNGTMADVCHRKTKNCGRKRIEVDLSQIASIPLNRRRTLRSLSQASGIRYSTLWARFKEGLIRRHSNAVRPHLQEAHTIARLKFCISMLDRSSCPHDPKFVGMYNIIHIDEKWFYITKRSKSYYLLPQEEDPLRTCQSKHFIRKVMFLAAIARPRFDDDGNEIFSGKIGIFPLVTQKPALRRSRNRNAGTLETKPIESVKKETIRAFLLEKVIPSIQAMWPSEDSRSTIFIQQDNARTHVHPDDEEFRAAASQNGFDIRLMCQPANSPDLNVLDLGFFNAIQSLQDKECTRTVDELIHAVEKSFEEYPTSRINHVFLTLQLCMKEIMKLEGSNRYKTPHIKKVSLDRNHILPMNISCDYLLVERVMNILATRSA